MEPIITPVRPAFVNPGDRIQVHPATDLWMRGDRYGTVISTGPDTPLTYVVRMDVSGLDRIIDIEDIYEVFP